MPDQVFLERHWPKDVPVPTEEQWAAAEQRYHAENRSHNQKLAEEGKVDLSDWQCGLGFVVATFSPQIWMSLFYPEEEFPRV